MVVSGDTGFDHRSDVSGFAGVGPMRQGFSALSPNDPNGFAACHVRQGMKFSLLGLWDRF